MDSVLPKHVTIIMDGNGRWAKTHGLPRVAGHRAGKDTLRKVIKFAAEKKIAVLSLFAFSTENWNRPKDEVTGLMRLFLVALKTESKKLHESGIQLRIIGDVSGLPEKVQQEISHAQTLTANNLGMKVVIAVNYGGRWDIVQAAKMLAKQIEAGQLVSHDINEELFTHYLSMSDLPDPDLFIRTSGELRISNFFLWQLAYTEFYFTDVLWPEFDEKTFSDALDAFEKRQRRFGNITNKRG